MANLIDLTVLYKMNRLIRMQATGKPESFAESLGISSRRLYIIIDFLRNEMQAPIVYNKCKQSYEYEYVPKFFLGYLKDDRRVDNPNMDGEPDDGDQYSSLDGEESDDFEDELEEDQIQSEEMIKISGGVSDDDWTGISDDDDSDGTPIEDDINFNDLFLDEY